MNQTRTVVLVVVVLVLLGVAGYIYLGRAAAPDTPQQLQTYGVCLATGEQGYVMHALGEDPPYMCPGTEQRAFYPLYYCYDTKVLFVPYLIRDGEGPPRVPSNVRCPVCGGENVVPYSPEWPTGVEIEGDVVLPPWP